MDEDDEDGEEGGDTKSSPPGSVNPCKCVDARIAVFFELTAAHAPVDSIRVVTIFKISELVRLSKTPSVARTRTSPCCIDRVDTAASRGRSSK